MIHYQVVFLLQRFQDRKDTIMGITIKRISFGIRTASKARTHSLCTAKGIYIHTRYTFSQDRGKSAGEKTRKCLLHGCLKKDGKPVPWSRRESCDAPPVTSQWRQHELTVCFSKQRIFILFIFDTFVYTFIKYIKFLIFWAEGT